MYPIEKYRYYTTKTASGDQKVIAVSTYAGRTVRGTAICHPQDTFDLEKGKEIAAARCAVKIAAKRMKRAERKRQEAMRQARQAKHYERKMTEYLHDADLAYDVATRALEDTLKNL